MEPIWYSVTPIPVKIDTSYILHTNLNWSFQKIIYLVFVNDTAQYSVVAVRIPCPAGVK